MKLHNGIILGLLCLFTSCQSNDQGSEPTKKEQQEPKEREDIVLSRAELSMLNATNVFAFNLLKQVSSAETKDQNLFISPLSASLCLSMVANGANGNTLTEMQKTLGFTSSQQELNEYNKRLVSEMLDLDNTTQLGIANSIWLRNKFAVKESFVSVNKQAYDAQVENLDFDSPKAIETINGWCAKKTENRITDVIKELTPDMKLVLINALYFKGKWLDPFEEEWTKKETFTNEDGSTTQVDMMHQGDCFRYTSNDVVSIAELPYGNEAFSMVLFLPAVGKNLKECVAELSNEKWQQWNTEMSERNISIGVPKFKMKYERDMRDDLIALGMKDAFSAAADFRNITDAEALNLNAVKQFTYLEVNEEGTESAAITVNPPPTSPSPEEEIKIPELILNRPFAYLIKEKSTGAILFMGEVNQF